MTTKLTETDLVLVRHAPIATAGHLFGRTDVAAAIPDETVLEPLRAHLSNARNRVCSPALRCRQTAQAIWGDDHSATMHPELWEQSFGDWEGLPYAELPDIGLRSGAELAAHAAPNGESFDDLCARATPVLQALADARHGPTVAVVHAGIVRAALAMALGSSPLGLKFDVACLSATRISACGDAGFSIQSVNVCF